MLSDLLRKNWLFFGLYLWVLVGVGVLQVLFSQEQLMQWVNFRNSEGADFLFPYITYMGDGAFAVVLCLLAVLYNRWISITLFASYALSGLTTLFLKTVVYPNSLRPLKFFEHSTYTYHLIKGLDIYSYNSFPSGHTTTAFALFSMLAFWDKQKKRGWFWLLLGVLTGYSRVYLFQHFVEDTFIGSMVGTISSIVVYIGMYNWVSKKKQMLEK